MFGASLALRFYSHRRPSTHSAHSTGTDSTGNSANTDNAKQLIEGLFGDRRTTSVLDLNDLAGLQQQQPQRRPSHPRRRPQGATREEDFEADLRSSGRSRSSDADAAVLLEGMFGEGRRRSLHN